MKHGTFVAILMLSLSGCVALDREPSNQGGTGSPQAPGSGNGTTTNPPEESGSLLGTYEGEQRWDLSELVIIEGGGDAVAASVVDAIVDASGIPSFAKSQARSVVDGLIGDAVAAYVDREFGGGQLVVDLSDALGSIRLGTVLSVEDRDGDVVTGVEQIQSMVVSVEGRDIEVPLGSAISVLGYDEVVADVEGRVSADDSRLSIERHDYMLRVDSIITIAGVDVLGYNDLEAALASIIDCDDLLDSITGSAGELSFSAAGYDFTLSSDQLGSACTSASDEAQSFVLDFFRRDAGVSAGGDLLIRSEGGRVTSLVSGDYSGAITLLPLPIDPTFAVDVALDRVR